MKAKNIRRALLLSALSVLLCVSMLIGTTFAWFTDSVTSGSNIIQSGKLDIVLEYWNGSTWVDAEGKVIPFVAADGREQSQILWEPGCTYELAPFRVRNEGNLNTKFIILLNGVTGDEKLMEVIELKTRFNNFPESMLNGSAGNVYRRFEDAEYGIMYGMDVGNVIFDESVAAKGQITAGTGHTDTSAEFTIVGHMAEEAGNEYQNLAIEGISITVIATQQTYESDSFNKYYDQNAKLPVVDHAYMDENAPATKIGSADSDKVAITVPAGAPKGNYHVVVSNENITIDENGQTTFSADIDLLKDGVKVQVNGTTVYLVEIDIGKDMVVAKVLHKGEEITNFTYDSDSGIISFETASFSPFAVIFEENKEIKVTTADELKAAFENVTEPVVINATGVVVNLNGAEHYTIPGGVTLKGVTFNANYRGINYVMYTGSSDEKVVFENCSFGNTSRILALGGTVDGPDSVIYNNCTFSGQVLTNFVDNLDGVAEFNNCTFTKSGSGGYHYIEAMGGTHNFNNCTFDYTGVAQNSMGVITSGQINVYSESEYWSVANLTGCARINCGTRKYGANSTLTIK